MTTQIASIYYMPQRSTRAMYQGDFRLEAVKHGEKPFILMVPDHYQIETQPWFKGLFNGKQLQVRVAIPGEVIAADILQDWTVRNHDMNPQCHPGIWIVRDRIPLTNEKGEPQNNADGTQAYRMATEEEKKAMFAEDLAEAMRVQANWDNACIQKGDIMAEDIKKIPFIPEYCKEAARYRGRDRKWLHELTDGDIKSCAWCTKTIPQQAVVCPDCGNVVDAVRYAQMKAAEQTAVDAATKGVVRPPVGKQAA